MRAASITSSDIATCTSWTRRPPSITGAVRTRTGAAAPGRRSVSERLCAATGIVERLAVERQGEAVARGEPRIRTSERVEQLIEALGGRGAEQRRERVAEITGARRPARFGDGAGERLEGGVGGAPEPRSSRKRATAPSSRSRAPSAAVYQRVRRPRRLRGRGMAGPAPRTRAPQHVAGAAHGVDQLGLEVGVDLAAEVVHVDVDHVGEGVEADAPDVLGDERRGSARGPGCGERTRGARTHAR